MNVRALGHLKNATDETRSGQGIKGKNVAKTPNSKFQAPEKHQVANPKSRRRAQEATAVVSSALVALLKLRKRGTLISQTPHRWTTDCSRRGQSALGVVHGWRSALMII